MTKKRLISASEMEKEYNEKRALAEKYYIEVLQPKMLAVAKEKKFYELFLNKYDREYFPELDKNPDKVEITSAVFDLLVDLGYKYKIMQICPPTEQFGVGVSLMTIVWDKKGELNI